MKIEEGFGPSGLGIISVSDVSFLGVVVKIPCSGLNVMVFIIKVLM